jgi:predicted Zn-dependent protease with MMP-like domain
MKKQITYEVYDTTSTELASALRAIGCDVVDEDPIRRIFSEEHPCNPSVSHGLKRGGQVQYRLKGESEEFDAKTFELARAYADSKESKTLDETLATLRDKTRGTEAGQLVEEVIKELPQEIMRYIRLAFVYRRELIDLIATKQDLVELIKIKKADGHYILHHAGMPSDKLKELLEA